MTNLLMQDGIAPYARLTEITYTVLEDTDFYAINWANVQPIVWGKETGEKYVAPTYFYANVPQKTFPSAYLANDESLEQTCGFDYHFIGSADHMAVPDCTNQNSLADEQKR